VEADDLAQHPQVARARGGAGGEQAADAAGTGILQAATGAVDDMLMSESWVATPSSPNRRSSVG